jgi:hypothetical protein
VPPIVIWIILGITALNLILTSVAFFRGLAAENRLQEQFENLPSAPSLGDLDLPELGG